MKQLTTGMCLDELPVEQREGSWRKAKNILVYKRGNAITNENGVENVTPNTYPADKLQIGSIPLPNGIILFFATENEEDSELGFLSETNTYTVILKDAVGKVVLNFNQNYPISGVYENKYNNNIVIAWTDNNNPYRVLNIDCLPFKVDVNKVVETSDLDKAKTLINLFSDVKYPLIEPYKLEVIDGQGSLSSGVYYPIVAYEFSDGTSTSWSKVYNGVPIFKDSLNQNTTLIGGGYGGESTTKAISIEFTELDTNYKKLKIGYLYVKNSVTLAYFEKSLDIVSSSLKVILTSSNQVQLDLKEVLVPNIVYSKGKTLTTLQKKLYLGNLEEPDDFNYQTYANAITVRWVREKEVKIIGTAKSQISSGTMTTNGTFQDGSKIFFDKSFKSGEVYALYIILNFKNGKRKAYHIPGRVANAGERDVIPSSTAIDAIDGGNDIYEYQVNGTSSMDSTAGPVFLNSGDMGYWENENEQYPLDPNNALNVHPDFANISGISTSDRKVRHHMFPSQLEIITNSAGNLRFLDGSFGADNGDTYPLTDVKAYSLGITVSSVEIPAALLPLIDSWEIGYALRDASNIRIIGMDTLFKNGNDAHYRSYFFDLMYSKTGLKPTYLNPLFEYAQNPAALLPFYGNYVEDLWDVLISSSGIGNINKFLFLGENVTVPQNNSTLSENIYIESVNHTDPGFQYVLGTGGGRIQMYDFCIYKRDIYLNFNTQKIISTGQAFKVTGSGMQSSKDIYGGDIHICRYSVNPYVATGNYLSYAVESIANIGLRTEDLTQSKYFAPKYANPTGSWYGYNKDYNCINDFNILDIYYPTEDCSTGKIINHPNRIAISLTSNDETAMTNWRIFKANSYYEMIKNKGEIWSLNGENKTLYIHHKYSLFVAEIKDRINTNTEEVYLGSSDIFDRVPTEIVTDKDGVAGTQSQYACIICKIGYCFIDREKGKVFVLFHGGGLKEISNNSLFNYFLNFSQTSQKNIDNPFIEMGYTMGYDDVNNRLLISKRDDGEGAVEFTLSYNFDLNQGKGGWVCFHDYFPNQFISNRLGFFATKNATILKHNANNKCIFYNDEIGKSYIDVVFNESPDQSKKFDNVNWISVVENNGLVYKKLTATHLMAYNDTQCSGEISLKSTKYLWYGKDAKNTEDTWNFNNFKDLVKDVSNPFLDNQYELITSNILNSKAWFDKSKFISKFVIFRIINDNVNQYSFHLVFVGCNIKKSDR